MVRLQTAGEDGVMLSKELYEVFWEDVEHRIRLTGVRACSLRAFCVVVVDVLRRYWYFKLTHLCGNVCLHVPYLYRFCSVGPLLFW